jgi:hypothetical protein
MNLCYLAKFGKNKFNLWHMLLGAIAGGAHTVRHVRSILISMDPGAAGARWGRTRVAAEQVRLER